LLVINFLLSEWGLKSEYDNSAWGDTKSVREVQHHSGDADFSLMWLEECKNNNQEC